MTQYVPTCIPNYFKSEASQELNFFRAFRHIAQGDHNFDLKGASYIKMTLQSLQTHNKPTYIRIWVPGEWYWAHRSAPDAPLERSVAMMEGCCHQDFSIDFFHIAHCDRHCIPHGPHLHSSTVITLGDDPGGRYTRIWVPWDPYWPC